MSTALSIAPAQAVIIKVIKGPNRGDNYRIVSPGAIIGRDPSVCKIVLNDEKVSRQQCRIDFRPNGITLEDLSGKGTTLVNDQTAEYVTLQSNDYINLGDSKLTFEISGDLPSPAASQPSPAPSPFGGINQIPGTQPVEEKKNHLPKIIIGLLLAAIVGFLMLPNAKKAPPAPVTTEADKDLAIEEVIKRQEELGEKSKNLTRNQRNNKNRAEGHFIRGFRDYQNHKYSRALEAFQTSLATDPNHRRARRYYKLAKKRQQDIIDYHMDLGNKYKQKSMYKFCIAQFGKVLQIINQPSNKKYKLAKEQIKECRLSKQRSF